MRSRLILYILIVAVLTGLSLGWLLQENHRILVSSGISLARLIPTFLIPAVAGFLCALGTHLGFLGLTSASKKLCVILALIAITAALVAGPLAGHLGSVEFAIGVVPALAISGLTLALGWWGFFTRTMLHTRAPSAAVWSVAFFVLWIVAVFAVAMPPGSFAIEPLIEFTAAAVIVGILQSRLRDDDRGLFFAVVLQVILLVAWAACMPVS